MKDKLILVVSSLLALVAVIVIFNLMEKHEKDRAIIRCGSEENIVEKYTKQGDIYYLCVSESVSE